MEPSQTDSDRCSSTPCESIGAVILLREDGAALLQHRDDKPCLHRPGMWVMPGGHCEPGESLEACARREFREETNYDCKQLHWLIQFVDDEDRDEGWFPSTVTVFWALYDGVQQLQCLEGQDLKFVKRSEVSAYLTPGHTTQIWDLALAAARIQVTNVSPAGS